jgi:hypothetical protein
VTRAQDQAVFLHALAAHLEAGWYVDLVTPHISWSPDRPARLHVGSLVYGGSALLAWAESIDVDELEVRIVTGGEAHVHAHGRIGGHAVDVWDAVPALNDTGLTSGEIVSIDVLRAVS